MEALHDFHGGKLEEIAGHHPIPQPTNRQSLMDSLLT
jgi:hypothetical protein